MLTTVGLVGLLVVAAVDRFDDMMGAGLSGLLYVTGLPIPEGLSLLMLVVVAPCIMVEDGISSAISSAVLVVAELLIVNVAGSSRLRVRISPV